MPKSADDVLLRSPKLRATRQPDVLELCALWQIALEKGRGRRIGHGNDDGSGLGGDGGGPASLDVMRVVHINRGLQRAHLQPNLALPGTLVHVIQTHGHDTYKGTQRGQNDQELDPREAMLKMQGASALTRTNWLCPCRNHANG